ncbi:M28 family peptidase [candidate division KSB1 bacterium]|nr:M28 family peptidase [candidate division KSB1 bacterium]
MKNIRANSVIVLITYLISSLFVMQCSQTTSEQEARDVFRQLVEIPGVSFHEELVAGKIRELLPANVTSEVDQWGNVLVTIGSGKPEIMFVAHMDEIGLEITAINDDGTISVRSRGGFFSTIWESKVVKIRTASGSVDGIIEPRNTYMEIEPENHRRNDLKVYVGTNSKAETEYMGIEIGNSIVQIKRTTPLGVYKIVAGSIDDRAGCTAQILALRMLAGKKLNKTVRFAWVVQEETGLTGSRRLSQVYSPDFVFAVDTFVSSDAPLDNQAIGYAPLGGGAVIRVFDSSNIASEHSVNKIREIAHSRNIPIQWGITSGGNDGSVFLLGGSEDIPLSWPGIYSHSYVSVLDIRDLIALSDLIVGVAESF